MEGKEGNERRGQRRRQRSGRRGPGGGRRGTDPRAARARASPAPPRPPRHSPRPRPPDRERRVPVRPAGVRCGVRAAHPSRAAASAAREPGSRRGLRLPATAARSFLQGHGELAEGVEERAEAAGQAQHHDAQVAPHRPGPARQPLPPRPPPCRARPANWSVGSGTAQPRPQQVPPPRPPRARPSFLLTPSLPPSLLSSPRPAQPPSPASRLPARGPDTASAAVGPSPECGQLPDAQAQGARENRRAGV